MKNERGITLIALIITIIVLLILAGVSINLVIGQNGILNNAMEAKKATSRAQAEEEVNLAIAAYQIEKTQHEIENPTIWLMDYFSTAYGVTANVGYKGDNFLITYNGYQFEVSDSSITSQEAFNAEEWDKTATPEEYFIWGSDIENAEGYRTIIGYTSSIQNGNHEIIRIPTRCDKILAGSKVEGGNEAFPFSSTYDENMASRAFTNGVKKIELPDTVTEIVVSQNYDFSKLENINIPDSVTNIGDYAFSGCTSLTGIVIPDSVTMIGRDAFKEVPCVIYKGNAQGAPWGANTAGGYVEGNFVYVDDTKTTLSYVINVTGEVVIPSGVTVIGDNAFLKCTRLTAVTIPNTVTSIGRNAFYGCTSLESIVIPEGVTALKAQMCYGCTALKNVTLPSSITSIGNEGAPPFTNIAPDAVFNVIEGSDIDTYLQTNKRPTQTINYITE